ncbi:9be7ff2c-00ce-4db7-9790-18a4e62b706e [Thermothielavioides terrestris]|uniref:9be7ff2c-00ce-4db7-9790-18a4e62b706e n=1 Tax=Thermothielavioides terrestris TaxID=2587410 RepID=A0A3S4F2H3_9PEZI|nr:9be7ff2c-00ce-4db7-9790-18a4e62b706e [Thermothielavioides terrestris]
MSDRKPIFVATHPRACSTAFERVFMTRRDILHCVHEPFGDAFYFGPERLSERYEKDEAARKASGFDQVTFKDVGKRVFIKDIAHYLLPPNQKPASIAPSLRDSHAGALADGATPNGAGTGGASHSTPAVPNPTVIPLEVLRKFHFTFLIRHPRRAIPSYYRCTVPPLSARTGFHQFIPAEAGYDELRRLFDYLLQEGVISRGRQPQQQQQQQPHKNGNQDQNQHEQQNGDDDVPAPANTGNVVNGPSNSSSNDDSVPITVVDADDLLDKPAEVVRAFCAAVGIDYRDAMLRWAGDAEGQRLAEAAFAKWDGFHDDAIASCELRARGHAKATPTEEEEDEEWREKYGEEAQKVIRACVDANVADYEYLKSFAIQV